MYMFITSAFLVVVGLPGNILLVYLTAKNMEKVKTAELLILHLSVSNIMQLISRIHTLTIPDQYGVCYPISLPCKVTIFVLYSCRKVSMSFTLVLGIFRFVKLRNKNRNIGNNVLQSNNIHIYLALCWIVWIIACLPYVLFLPTNRTSSNTTGSCICSFLPALTVKDVHLKTFDIVLGFVTPMVAVILMIVVNINILWILLKHQNTVFTEMISYRYRSNQHEIKAVKIIAALVLCFVTCNLLHSCLRNLPSHIVDNMRKIVGDVYPAISPYILGLGYRSFRRKLMCKRCSRNCHKSNVEQVITVS